mmetsp:Transcript_42563/g.101060  ORF Transcript_42563/g.101060 Transcript_42563/m.101060 type:complete len:200 (-) Transcript_42563:1270-1869(-)
MFRMQSLRHTFPPLRATQRRLPRVCRRSAWSSSARLRPGASSATARTRRPSGTGRSGASSTASPRRSRESWPQPRRGCGTSPPASPGCCPRSSCSRACGRCWQDSPRTRASTCTCSMASRSCLSCCRCGSTLTSATSFLTTCASGSSLGRSWGRQAAGIQGRRWQWLRPSWSSSTCCRPFPAWSSSSRPRTPSGPGWSC